MNWNKNDSTTGQEFSFKKLHENLISNAGILNTFTVSKKAENISSLKFEPNLNITRKPGFEPNIVTRERSHSQHDKNIVGNIIKENLSENISSRFSEVKREIKKEKKNIITLNIEKLEGKAKNKVKKDKSKLEKDFKSVITNSKDKNVYLPITIPFKDEDRIDEEKIQSDMNIINDAIKKCEINDFFLFQFPRIIPIKSSIEKAVVENEQMKEEPTYDNHGFLVKPDFENHFKDFPKNSKIGKLKVYKSGKVKMQIGEVMFNVDLGVNTNFAQEMSVISKESKEAFFIGKLKENSFIVTPEII